MELFFIGLVAGVAIMLLFFVVWNFEKPDALDKAEASVRNLTDEYEEAKAKVKAKIKRK